MDLIRKPVPLLIFALGLSGISLSQAADISITRDHIDAGAQVFQDAPGYLTLENNDNIPVTLKTVDSDAATRTEILEHSMKDGSMVQLKKGVVLHPGKPVRFDDGHLQVIFKGLKSPLRRATKLT